MAISGQPGTDLMILDEEGQATDLSVEKLNAVGPIALSPDHRYLAIGHNGSRDVVVINLSEGKLVRQFAGTQPRADSTEFTFSPDGRWLVIGGQGDIRTYEVGTWQPGPRLVRERLESSPAPVAFSRDGNLLAVAYSRDQVRLLDPNTFAELATLTSYDPQVITNLSFGPDNTQLIVATANQSVQFWDLRRLRAELASLNLDWQTPTFPPALATASLPVEVEVYRSLQPKKSSGSIATKSVRTLISDGVRWLSVQLQQLLADLKCRARTVESDGVKGATN
jgi:WD40 repeat protein